MSNPQSQVLSEIRSLDVNVTGPVQIVTKHPSTWSRDVSVTGPVQIVKALTER